VAISQFVDFERIYGPEAVSRFNMLKSVNVNGKSNPGFSSGDAIIAVQEVAAQHLQKPTYEFSGLTREEIIAETKQLVFYLSLIFVYFLLSSVRKLFSSAINSSFITGWCRWSYWFRLSLRIGNNIYFQVALIMLIGLLAKNAILIVEFAIQRRRNGMDLTKAAIEGARARLRLF
jgi:HAE1 family hydrophobic/amphiphilic exporter-1